MTPDRFIAAAFTQLAYEGTNWNLYVTAEFIHRVEQRASELARESVGDGEDDSLKPCPLCAGESTWHAGSDNIHSAGATCKLCGLDLWEQDPGCMDRARTAWNTRPALLRDAGDGWRSIESAPHTGIAVLLWQPWKSGRDCTTIGHYANGWCDRFNEEMTPEPTHWRPLPAPPTEGN